ncbi:hypothetical protein Q8F55_004553 [Vanrija albida]|uniref:RNase III domain-containing protein n=1 Tax=Vanrija albida TaxID=181172 RepID=A0ABR3Q7B9_9TREE
MSVTAADRSSRVLELEELQQSQPSTKPPESTEPLTHAFTGLESDVLGLTRPVAPLPKKSKKSKKSKKAKKDPKPDCAKGHESAEGKALRKQVFTSKSAAPAHNFRLSYEPLEQLGDGILEMTTRLLIHDEYDELTWKRRQDIKVRIVKNETLGLVSRHYALRDMLLTGKKNAGDCADSPTKVDADVFEAFLGGLLKDRGYKKTRNWIRDVIEPILIWLNSQMEAELLVF